MLLESPCRLVCELLSDCLNQSLHLQARRSVRVDRFVVGPCFNPELIEHGWWSVVQVTGGYLAANVYRLKLSELVCMYLNSLPGSVLPSIGKL